MTRNRLTHAFILLILLVVIACASARCAVIRVSTLGDDTAGGSAWVSAKKTVTAALAAAAAGDEIWVAAGTYVERIALKDGVQLYGGFAGTEEERGQRNWATNVTILDGSQGGNVVTANSGVTSSARIDGFTIQNGRGITLGGVYCNAASPTICNNTITRNFGGIVCVRSSSVIANNMIVENSGSLAIVLSASAATLSGNTICRNEGWAIYSASSPAPTISNNIAANNSQGFFSQSSTGATPTFRNNCIYNPQAPVQPELGRGPGDIVADPRLVSAEHRQYHIQPDSPCVDAGFDDAVEAGWVDMDGQPRIQGSHVDIGADESDGTAWVFAAPAIRVSMSGDDANNGSTWSLAKRTVQAAIDAAAPTGYDVWVASGAYIERIYLKGGVELYGGFVGNETLLSQRDWAINKTILDGAKGGAVVDTDPKPAWPMRVDGFDIINGNSSAIVCNASLLTICNNTLTGNDEGTRGGIIHCTQGSPVISDNFILNNTGAGIRTDPLALSRVSGNTISGNSGVGFYGTGYYGARESHELSRNTITDNAGVGVYLISCYAPRISENTITGNRGGGVSCTVVTEGTISNNTISGNSSAGNGGGIYSSNSSLTISGNTIASNTVAKESGEALGCGVCCVDGTQSILNNDISNNKAPMFVSVRGGGVYVSSGRLSGNTIRDNSAEGVYCKGSGWTISGNHISGHTRAAIGCDSANGAISSNVITRNGVGIGCLNSSLVISSNAMAANTTGISSRASSATITNNTIVLGVSGIESQGSPVVSNNILAFNGTGFANTGGNAVLRNNCVYNPDGTNYSGVAPGVGDISVDPKLASSGPANVHIRADSPCRDAGWSGAPGMSPVDVDGNARVLPAEGAVDMGADEFDGAIYPDTYVTVRVTPDGDDANDGSSWTSAKKTVRAAVEYARATGGEIWVRAGTYNESIDLKVCVSLYGGFRGGETSRSERDWKLNETILDAGWHGSAVLAYGSPSWHGAIDGFTIRNGSHTNGGGIYCEGPPLLIANNTIINNDAPYGRGGGIYCVGNASIVNNVISGNNAAGVYYVGSGEISHNTMRDNRGDAIYCTQIPASGGGPPVYSKPVISNNLISGNWGGIAYMWSSGATICNNTIVASARYGILTQVGSATISNNIVANNGQGVVNWSSVLGLRNNCVYGSTSGGNYHGIEPGEGDISVDPRFCDRAGGDYHLSAQSPCINAGWSGAAGIGATDMDGETRAFGSSVDIGADEFAGVALSFDDAKKSADGSAVSGYRECVTAALPGCFYLESDDRACGIRVDKPGHGLTVGMRVGVTGTLATNSDGERYIAADSVSISGTGNTLPFALNNSALGGGAFGLQDGVWGWQLAIPAPGEAPVRTWAKSTGLNNIGLLIRTTGRILPELTTSTSFTIDDGSEIKIKCIVPDGVTIDPAWSRVSVTGISSCEKVHLDGHDELHSVVRVRSASDIISM